jgi:hypothetical protein
MPNYHFDLQNNGARIEDIAGVTLANDGEAIAFGKRVIRELLDKNPEQRERWTMDITEGERTVHSIPLTTAIISAPIPGSIRSYSMGIVLDSSLKR